MEPLVQLTEGAVPPALFRRLMRRLGRVGRERLRDTYQTTFWYDFGPPANVVEEIITTLRPGIAGRRRVAGVEWWLSRMYTTDVRVDFHQDRDEKLARRTGELVHPRIGSVLFLNRVRGGALVVTRELPEEGNPSLAPSRMDTADVVAPRPNRLVVFDGALTHGVLDAENRIPDGKLPGRSRLRRTLVMNWWAHRPTDVPAWAQTRHYRALAG
ncbi:hypothetical protein LZ198_01655 [Myxococcus sp. K15C18031901]|uniref:hypothetical protein n=1 Tax=Myxococcus dinghuensis TaxID=2906761 RepID=UPI0020A776E1|nr:hypothetical protein [Myxococcus dinghuensis]MCP3097575.1 hypothetical protein [Myxococcus dinghuensis]